MSKEEFFKISDHNELALYFDVSYVYLSNILYKADDSSKYRNFTIPKKNGDNRVISSPNKGLKAIQNRLKEVLYDIYPCKKPVHGFAKKRSIVTNARNHINKKFIFNIDLQDFFGSIHFGRVRNLFKSHPFNFSHSVSTILAQICCFQNSLPQGAPTSPIIANMISWKMDSQLQRLTEGVNGTYTRYADDISFSFTCKKSDLPKEIVFFKDGLTCTGAILTDFIVKNGFVINAEKVRLCSRTSRMDVTGLTVNEFPNVKRQYIKQLSSMLHAWRKHGYEAAEKEFNEKYDIRHRASKNPKSYLHVLKGKLSFLRSVRSERDAIFNKLAMQFNDLADEPHRFKTAKAATTHQNIVDALWVIETLYDDVELGEPVASQGSAFHMEGVGILTCAHVVSSSSGIHKQLQAFRYTKPDVKYPVEVLRICQHRDVAICSIAESEYEIMRSTGDIEIEDSLKMYGFPGFAPGQTYFKVDIKVARTSMRSLVERFEIDNRISKGNSGGPIVNQNYEVVGIVVEGEHEGEDTGGGRNSCIKISAIDSVMKDNKYLVNHVCVDEA